jgi:hypothetical protein
MPGPLVPGMYVFLAESGRSESFSRVAAEPASVWGVT